MPESQNRDPLVKLSDRLAAIAGMVDGKSKYGRAVLCDVGTDHAHIPIRLLQEGRIDCAIAMDVIPGPIMKARENLDLYGVEPSLVELRLSDGLDAYRIGEAQTLVIAGMGGRMMSRILLREPEKSLDFEEMILQPQADPEYVRRAVRQLGLSIDREKLVLEEGKYYPVMHVVRCEDVSRENGAGQSEQALCNDFSEMTASARQQAEDLFGPVLLREKDETLRRYLLRQKGVCERILHSLENARKKESPEVREKRDIVTGQLSLIAFALQIIRSPS